MEASRCQAHTSGRRKKQGHKAESGFHIFINIDMGTYINGKLMSRLRLKPGFISLRTALCVLFLYKPNERK